MRAKLLIGIAVPLVFASVPAMAFGVLGLIIGIVAAAVSVAGGTALSSGGVGPVGQSGATAISPESGTGSPSQTAWASTGSVDEFTGLLQSGSRGAPQMVVRVLDLGRVHGSPDTLAKLAMALLRRPGVDQRTVNLCRDALARTVAAHGAVQVDAASAGRSSRQSSATIAPLTARVIYRLATGYEVKQATVACQMTRAGMAVLAR